MNFVDIGHRLNANHIKSGSTWFGIFREHQLHKSRHLLTTQRWYLREYFGVQVAYKERDAWGDCTINHSHDTQKLCGPQFAARPLIACHHWPLSRYILINLSVLSVSLKPKLHNKSHQLEPLHAFKIHGIQTGTLARPLWIFQKSPALIGPLRTFNQQLCDNIDVGNECHRFSYGLIANSTRILFSKSIKEFENNIFCQFNNIDFLMFNYTAIDTKLYCDVFILYLSRRTCLLRFSNSQF